MCENLGEFRAYVGSMLQNRNKIPAKISYNGCSTILDIESVQFIFCKNLFALKGHTFGKDDYIEKVGAWYNLPTEFIDNIKTEFKARVKA